MYKKTSLSGTCNIHVYTCILHCSGTCNIHVYFIVHVVSEYHMKKFVFYSIFTTCCNHRHLSFITPHFWKLSFNRPNKWWHHFPFWTQDLVNSLMNMIKAYFKSVAVQVLNLTTALLQNSIMLYFDSYCIH